VPQGSARPWRKQIHHLFNDPAMPSSLATSVRESETDKVSMEVPATAAGVLAEIASGSRRSGAGRAVVAVLSGAAGATAAPGVEVNCPLRQSRPAASHADCVADAPLHPPQTAPPTPPFQARSFP